MKVIGNKSKKLYNIVFVIVFLSLLTFPIFFAKWSEGELSTSEKRYLAKYPQLLNEHGKYNEKFTSECETWFMDHMGLREQLIGLNAKLQFYVFDRVSTPDFYLGPDGDLNYATKPIIHDYAHLNLRDEKAIKKIGDSYQTISDYLEQRDMQFFYIQCFDKHSIYPEQFMDTINQIGTVSKTDQIMSYVEKSTDVNLISMKPVMLEAKKDYEVYSNWGDATHWTPRGAYIGYRDIMEKINVLNGNKFRVLQENDYTIQKKDLGVTIKGAVHKEDILEEFVITEAEAQKLDKKVMGEWANTTQSGAWKNDKAENDVKVLFLCDSYIFDYVPDDFAESFSEIWFVSAGYIEHIDEILEDYNPDIVIYETAERVDRSDSICKIAKKLSKSKDVE